MKKLQMSDKFIDDTKEKGRHLDLMVLVNWFVREPIQELKKMVKTKCGESNVVEGTYNIKRNGLIHTRRFGAKKVVHEMYDRIFNMKFLPLHVSGLGNTNRGERNLNLNNCYLSTDNQKRFVETILM